MKNIRSIYTGGAIIIAALFFAGCGFQLTHPSLKVQGLSTTSASPVSLTVSSATISIDFSSLQKRFSDLNKELSEIEVNEIKVGNLRLLLEERMRPCAYAIKDRRFVIDFVVVQSIFLKTSAMLRTIFLLSISNIFMTYAWYGHLKDLRSKPLWIAIVLSWLIAFLEYCFQVPANRYGFGVFSLPQLKVTQEIITMVIFAGFSVFYMGIPVGKNFIFASLCLVGATYFIFQSK